MKITLLLCLLILLSCQKEKSKKVKPVSVTELPQALIGEWTKVSKPGREITTVFTKDSMITYDNNYRKLAGAYALENEYLTLIQQEYGDSVTFPIAIHGDSLYLPRPYVFIRRTSPCTKYD